DEILREKSGVFAGSSALSEVIFAQESGLKAIFGMAFAGTSVRTLTLPASVEYIGAYAFADVETESVTFEEGEGLEIDDYAFALSDGKEDSFEHFALAFSSGVRSVGRFAFANRKGISSVSLNDELEFLLDGAFYGCSITNLILPEGTAFETEEEGVTVGVFANNPVVELTLYHDCTMTQLFGGIPSMLNILNVFKGKIAEEQFRGVTSVKNLTLRDVDEIGDYAFFGCTGLNGVTVPASVTAIGDYAFSACSDLLAVVFENGSDLQEIGEYVFAEDEKLLEVDLPSSVISTEFVGVFYHCSALTIANIPASVRLVGDNAFAGCSRLVSIAIPEQVDEIGAHAFDGCGVLEFENVKFDRLVSLGEYAFAGCKLLHAVKAENIALIGARAFYGCEDLREITIIGQKVADLIDSPDKIVSVNVSSAAVTVAEEVFDGCTRLTAVSVFTAPEGIERIVSALKDAERYAAKIFVTQESYRALGEDLLTAMEGFLFSAPTDLNATYSFDRSMLTAKIVSVDVFDGAVLYLPSYVYDDEGVEYEVTAIGERVFRDNTSIEEVIVPFTVVKIEAYAFEACVNMRTLRFEIGSRLTYIGKQAFSRAESLTYVDLPDALEEIGERAFEYSGLITIDNTVYSHLKKIGERAFDHTERLDELVLYGAVEEIGDYAFSYSGVSGITFGSRMEDVTLGAYCFADCYNLSDETIAYVTENYTTDDTTFHRHA
ncbi:MAG: leucine-rich repeat protein, partial [Clostridia bacterium]|nr:leucine-rich repeat protein [Clostridia bacterium]